MSEVDWAARWKQCRQALLDAVDLQEPLGGEPYDRELVADFVEENDFANALLFGAALIRPSDDRPEARELAVLLLPQVEFLIDYERYKPTDPSPLPDYAETLERLKGVVHPTESGDHQPG